MSRRLTPGLPGMFLAGFVSFTLASCDLGLPPGAMEMLEPQHMKMLGQSAPDFELAQLDGTKVKLSSHRDKEVVILDMWATWCGPCVAELPVVAGIAEQYRSKGVATYAVNQGDQEETVSEFVKKEKLTLPVLLDKDGKVGDSYRADAIPMLVVVGKDGTIQSIHVGNDPNINFKLSRELDQLLSGKNLVPAAAPEKKE